MASKSIKTEELKPKLTNVDRKNLLIEALSYIGKFKDQIVVIKYGGAAMVHQDIKVTFSQDMNLLTSLGMRPVIVHGGGPEVSQTMKAMGHKSEFVEGLRVTTAEGLRIIEMVLSGNINKEIIANINSQGGNSIGLSGKDANLIQARKMNHVNGVDLGFVGEITSVNTEILEILLKEGIIPVVSPIGLGRDGTTYNINADTVASRIAAALKAEKIIFMTDVDGILDGKKLIPALNIKETKKLIKQKIIAGGMIPKVEAILHCLENGVSSAYIINGNEHHAIIAELFTDSGIGTQIIP